MKHATDFPEVFLFRKAADMRKQAKSLAVIIQEDMARNPFDEALYVFTNKRRNLLKCVYWRKTGFAMWVAYLVEEKFPWPKNLEQDVVTISPQQMEWLLQGLDIWKVKPHRDLQFKQIS